MGDHKAKGAPAWVWLAVAGAVGVAGLGLLALVVVGVIAFGGPTQAIQGEAWNHEELAGHLNSNGHSFAIRGSSIGKADGGVGAFFIDTRRHPKVADDLDEAWELYDTGLIFVYKYTTPQKAHDHEGLRGRNSFAWGCFLFSGTDVELLRRVKHSLR